MSTSPNKEQKVAIEHYGGVLLSAGAGSGKTFVLKEHLIFLANSWINDAKNAADPLDIFEVNIKRKLRKIVMMTFTKKAAGELQIRIEKEFFSKAHDEESPESDYWAMIYKNISQLTITTIHGFCFKLIRTGLFKNVSSDLEILSESEYKEEFQSLFESVLEHVLGNAREQEIANILLKEKKGIYLSVEKIFSDPGLRNLWCHDLGELGSNDDEVCEYLLNELELDYLIKNPLTEGEKFKGKKWWDFTQNFHAKIQNLSLGKEGFYSLFSLFRDDAFKIPTKPSAKSFDEYTIKHYEKIISIKDFFKAHNEDIQKYFDNSGNILSTWFDLIQKVVKGIDDRYDKISGVTFSDLEYIVFNALKDENVVSLIKQEYEYFIIDEFQDTSSIQFSIINKLTKSDLSNLFCVGDLKQAIYGFRGGELGVFRECESKVTQRLSLRNNYRSDKKIINFNNTFFDFIFAKGDRFEGEDRHAVEVEYQDIPEGKNDVGAIVKRTVSLSRDNINVDTLSNNDIEKIEAQVILDEICRLKKQSSGNIAVLYKKLKPSLLLINLLIRENISFTAQVKVPYQEDPIIGLYYALIEKKFNKNANADQYRLFIIENYLRLLGWRESSELDLWIKGFDSSVNKFGLFNSFLSFLDNVGIVNSNYSNNLTYLEGLEHTCAGNQQKILKILSELSTESYSYDFKYGQDSDQLILMTAHASKGLQFKNVILGGIHTNDGSINDHSFLGKLPYSFKWTDGVVGKNRLKTLTFIYENLLTKQKDFSEHKRLFYVACTRAESHLSWVDIALDEDLKLSKKSYKSWSQGLKTWEAETLNLSELIDTVEFDASNLEQITSLDSVKRPIFHTDSLGINFSHYKKQFTYLPELSVTRFTSLVECPKKFYLQNICMLDDKDIELLDKKVEFRAREDHSISSAGRGIILHEKLAELIDQNFTEPTHSKALRDFPELKWSVDKLKTYVEKYQFISEKPIKFELYGYMISGIPDLILKPNSDKDGYEIWDFKTGLHSEDKDKIYFFQIILYAYALYQLKYLDPAKQINLVLNYIDEKKIVEKKVFYADVDKYLNEVLCDLNFSSKENLSHCELCKYKNLCKK